MATASRTRSGPAAKARTTLAVSRTRLVLDRVQTWLVPALAGLAFVVAAVLSALELVPTGEALAIGVLAALVLLAYVGLRGLLTPGITSRDRALGGALGLFWIVACYLPFHARLFPGTPLLDQAHVSASGEGLPLTIPAAGHAAIDLLLEGKLPANPSGGAATPVHFTLTLEGSGGPQVVDGLFQDKLVTQRLGRRGSTVVHQTHSAEVRVLSNPSRQDLRVTRVALEPPTAQAITLTVYAHPLPGTPVLALAAGVLLALVVAFDRRGPVPTTDGAFALATTAVIGTAVIFWTNNAVHPDFHTLIGSAIFGGPLGFAAGAVLWWIVKRLIVARAA